MAVYGKDFYGLAKYGADVHVEYSVEPFQAVPDGYNAVRLSWTSPAGTWTNLRLLRSRLGYAVNANDGDVLFDSATSASAWMDSDLSGGAWYYYTLYLKADGRWYRVGVTSAFVVKSHQFGPLLWDRIPQYFHYAPRYPDGTLKGYFNSAEVYDPSRTDQINQELQQFLATLGWGFDFLQTYHDTVLWANDAKRTHLENLDRLARTLGTSYEYEVPASVMRAKVANTALLARSRGTAEGLRDVLALSTGWDVEVSVGPNFFLSEDQANFANPTYPEWDSGTNYPVGHRVQYAGRVVEAKTGGAYGFDQRPPDAPDTDNTWWQVITDQTEELTRDPSTGAISTWKTWRDGSTLETTHLGVAISSPVDTLVSNSNALKVYNADASGHTYDVWGVANPTSVTTPQPQPERVVRQGLPIPRLLAWDAETDYLPGQMVAYRCRAFRARRDNIGREPDAYTNDWQQVGIDERPRLAFSFYAHADFDSSPGVAITPGVAFYDEHGGLLNDLTTAHHSDGAFFDTFNGAPNTPIAARTPDQQFSAEQWTVHDGTWNVAEPSNIERVAWPVTGTGIITVTLPSEKSRYKIAVTFRRPGLTGHTQAIVLRYVDAQNYLQVTRTGVDTMATGSLTNVATFADPVADGDRVTVLMDETANTQTVYVNGTQVAQASGQPQPAAGVGSNRYRHGLMVI